MQLERNVQKLKRQKTPTMTQNKPSKGSSRKRSLQPEAGEGAGEEEEEEEGPDGTMQRKTRSVAAHMNLPASAPQVEFRDGIEWLHFTYSTKGHSEYCIRVDVDDLTLEEIPEDFKIDNCVYPRALVPKESYIGNRWEYETAVNEVAWKLCWKNPEALCGKRGLIQRAVDSYRNRATESRSRRVMRQDKLNTSGITPRRRNSSQSSSLESAGSAATAHPRFLSINYTDKDGAAHKLKLSIEIESVRLEDLSDEFKKLNCLYPQAFHEPDASYADGRWEYENACNELAWKLASINATKISGRRNLLQKAVDAYQTRIEACERARQSIRRAMSNSPSSFDPHHPHDYPNGLEKNEEFSQLVAHTLQQALCQQGGSLLGQALEEDKAAGGFQC